MIPCMKSWSPGTIDITTAFLHGEPLDREAYLFPPPEAQTAPNTLWKLKKAVYGLGDTGLKWYKRVVAVLQSLGGRKSEMDTAVFVFHSKEGELEGLVSVHVDDFFYCGGDSFERVLQGIGGSYRLARRKEALSCTWGCR